MDGLGTNIAHLEAWQQQQAVVHSNHIEKGLMPVDVTRILTSA